jgi:hypothetical protein
MFDFPNLFGLFQAHRELVDQSPLGPELLQAFVGRCPQFLPGDHVLKAIKRLAFRRGELLHNLA